MCLALAELTPGANMTPAPSRPKAVNNRAVCRELLTQQGWCLCCQTTEALPQAWHLPGQRRGGREQRQEAAWTDRRLQRITAYHEQRLANWVLAGTLKR